MASTTKKTTVKKKTTIKESRKAAFTARTEKEITATFLDGVGLTAKVASTLAAENVNILAGTGYSASGFRRAASAIRRWYSAWSRPGIQEGEGASRWK